MQSSISEAALQASSQKSWINDFEIQCSRVPTHGLSESCGKMEEHWLGCCACWDKSELEVSITVA